MKKVIGIVIGLAVLVGIALFLLASNIDGIVKNVIETAGSEMTGTRVSVALVEIDLRAGKGSIRGLSVANPEGYPAGNALSFSELTLDLDIGSLNSQPVIIDQVIVDGTVINLIGRTDGSSNLTTIYDHIDQESASSSSSESDDSDDTLLIIDDFRFTNTRMSMQVEDVPQLSQEISLSNVTATKVGRAQGGVTPEQAAKEIVEPLLEEAIAQGKAVMKNELKETATEELKRQLMKKLR